MCSPKLKRFEENGIFYISICILKSCQHKSAKEKAMCHPNTHLEGVAQILTEATAQTSSLEIKSCAQAYVRQFKVFLVQTKFLNSERVLLLKRCLCFTFLYVSFFLLSPIYAFSLRVYSRFRCSSCTQHDA